MLEYTVPFGSVNRRLPPLVAKLLPVTVSVVNAVVDATIVVGTMLLIAGVAAEGHASVETGTISPRRVPPAFEPTTRK